jgi:hypothetical protein
MIEELEHIETSESSPPSQEEIELIQSTDPQVQRRLRRLSLLWLTDNTSKILPKIFTKKHIYLQLLWTVFFIISGTISLALVIKYVRDYLEYKVNVNIVIIYESPTKFPAVTICNLNPFKKQTAQRYINRFLSQNNLTYVSSLQNLPPNQHAMNLSSTVQELIRASTATELSPEARKYVGFDIEDILISCTFNGVPCSSYNFSWTQSYYYGNCYTFNSGKDIYNKRSVIQQTSLSGINSGLQIEVYVGDPSTDELYNYKNGLHVVVHNQSVTPLIEAEGIQVPTGQETNVAVKRTFINKLGPPYSQCKYKLMSTVEDLDSLLPSWILNEFNSTTYRQKNCFNLCYQTKIIIDCNCTDPKFVYPVLNRTKISFVGPCKNKTQNECLAASLAQFLNNPISKDCSKYCPLECVTLSYSTFSTSAAYPTRSYAKLLGLDDKILKKTPHYTTDYEMLKYSMLKLNVFYEEMSYQTITESPALTWDILLGNIGGMLSLFIGVSIMTVGEVFELVFELVRVGLFLTE